MDIWILIVATCVLNNNVMDCREITVREYPSLESCEAAMKEHNAVMCMRKEAE